MCHFHEGNLAQAESILRDLIVRDTTYDDAYFQLARIVAIQQGIGAEAETLLAQAVVQSNYDREYLHQLAGYLQIAGQPEKALNSPIASAAHGVGSTVLLGAC